MATDIVPFFQRHFPMIRAKCARMLGNGDDAADVAQEAFLRLCTSPVAHEPPAARLKWIYVTGTRLCIDHLRRKRLGVEVSAGSDDDAAVPARASTPSPDGAVAARQALARLADALPSDDLAVLIMTRADRMTQEEVAAALDISSRQVRRVLERADAKLAHLIGQLG